MRYCNDMTLQFKKNLRLFNPFVSRVPFLYPHPENIKGFWFFQWVEKGCSILDVWQASE